MTRDELSLMRDMPIEDLLTGENCATDKTGVVKNPSKEQRILEYIDTVQNPYFLKVGNSIVRIQYAGNITLQKAMEKIAAG